MTDLLLALAWLGVLAAGIGAVLLLRDRGLPATHARDLLHVGAGVWVLGWPWWNSQVAPLAIVGAAVVAVTLVAGATPRSRTLDRLRRSVARGDEAFGGLVVYTLSFAVMTWLGLTAEPFPAAAFPAAAALWALALGDGVGGLVGRRYGRLSYTTRLGKRKTVEGSVAVAAFAGLGMAAAAAYFGADITALQVSALALTAAVAEGLAPRGTDNVLVPAAVFGLAALLT